MDQRESVLFIGTQFSNLYTAVDTPVNVQIFNDNLKELQVLESKRNAIRKGLVYELLNALIRYSSMLVFRAEIGRAE